MLQMVLLGSDSVLKIKRWFVSLFISSLCLSFLHTDASTPLYFLWRSQVVPLVQRKELNACCYLEHRSCACEKPIIQEEGLTHMGLKINPEPRNQI